MLVAKKVGVDLRTSHPILIVEGGSWPEELWNSCFHRNTLVWAKLVWEWAFRSRSGPRPESDLSVLYFPCSPVIVFRIDILGILVGVSSHSLNGPSLKQPIDPLVGAELTHLTCCRPR